MRIACVQEDVAFGDAGANVATVLRHLDDLGREHVELVIFPEAFLTGYCVGSPSEARRIAIGLEALEPIARQCDRVGTTAIVGFAELAEDRLYNSAALIEPGSPMRVYRKTHLPELGLDKYVTPGDELDVVDSKLGKVGVLICFDLRFPEPSRVLTLRGAELIALPTNWPKGAESSAEHVAITRAAENRVFVATCNRVGHENGFTFIGRSKIIHPSGKVLAAAGDGPEVIRADLDLTEARIKRNIQIPGKYETEMIASRRPELYRGLAPDPNS